jgi:hypothetical protein
MAACKTILRILIYPCSRVTVKKDVVAIIVVVM